jgi:hypothetical protein
MNKHFAWNVLMLFVVIYSLSLPYSGATIFFFIIWMATHEMFK